MYLKLPCGRRAFLRAFRRNDDGTANVIVGEREVLRLQPEDAMRLESRLELVEFNPIYPPVPLAPAREGRVLAPVPAEDAFLRPELPPCY